MSLSITGNSPIAKIKNVTPTINSNIPFRSQGGSNLQPLEKDTVEISNKQEKKKLSKGAKWAIGIGSALAIGIGGMAILTKVRANQLQKLYKEKLILSNLPEKIDFKEAKTVEEAMKFSKEVLGIKNIDKNFSLEALNWANKSIVDVSNANKGKLFIPQNMHFESGRKNTVSAWVNMSIDSKRFGDLSINKDFFNHETLDKMIKESVNFDKIGTYNLKSDASFEILNERFIKDPKSLSLKEKIKLFNHKNKKTNAFMNFMENKEEFLKENLKLFKNNGINVNLEEFKKLSRKEKTNQFDKYLKELVKKTGKKIDIIVPTSYPEKTIYHEMGHLQDAAKNLKEIDLENINSLNPLNIFKTKSTAINLVDDRWGKKSEFIDLFREDIKAFKLAYPQLHEHLTNPEIQKTAGKVSRYAQTGIGEFIADTYAELIKGTKLSDDVMALYKKYNGPIPGVG